VASSSVFLIVSHITKIKTNHLAIAAPPMKKVQRKPQVQVQVDWASAQRRNQQISIPI
jgi:hypothetical protein